MKSLIGNLKTKAKRYEVIDIVRAIAILLMIVTHVIAIAFSHAEGSSRVIYYLGLFGGIASFTMFLFISGATAYLIYVKTENTERKKVNIRKLKIFKRAVSILFLYYLLAAFSLWVNKLAFSTGIFEENIKDIVRILFFLRVPEFTEFLLTLVFFSISLILFRRIYKIVIKDLRLVLLVSAVSYAIGYLTYQIEFEDNKLNLIKALFSGHENLHTFPIFQYLPVYLLGMYLGKILVEHTVSKGKTVLRKIGEFLNATSILTVISVVLYSELDIATLYISPFESRFPPAVGFLLLSLAITYLFLFLSQTFLNLKNKRVSSLRERIMPTITYLSRNALSLFVWHTFVLLLLKLIQEERNPDTDWRYSSFIEIIVLYLIVVALSLLLIVLFNKAKTLYFYIDRHKNTHNFVVNIFLPVVSIIVALSTLGFAAYDNFIVSSDTTTQREDEISRSLEVVDDAEFWYDDAYRYYRAIEVGELTSDAVFISDSWGKVNFNHAAVVSNERLRATNGSDIRVVEYQNNQFSELPLIINNPNSGNTELIFKYKNNTDVSYYLFYGNDFSEQIAAPTDQSNSENAISFTLGEEVSHQIEARTNRRWFLVGDKDNRPILQFSIELDSELQNIQSAHYTVQGTELSGGMQLDSEGNYSTSIDLSEFEPGYYSIQARVVDLTERISVYQTYLVPFYVSEPVFVSWSLDWEGFQAFQFDLDAITNLSSKHGIPITQYFNPRIYLPEIIAPAEAAIYTDWVKQRARGGDEIALHLHFYPDVPAAAGVTPRTDAQLIGIGRNESYIQAYTEEELESIFEWSKELFEQNGLGTPTNFRSGAWMSGANVLSALTDTGFVIDSSGRTGGLLNPNDSGSTPIPWNLAPTTQPYQPSKSNINVSGDDPIGIWEFPNNGNDSFWFSIEDLKRNFDLNYPNKNSVSFDKKSIVYLSHPNSFTVYENNNISGLLDYTSNFLYRNDDGPVVYSTIQNTYDNWVE